MNIFWETLIKWGIPFLCSGIVAFVAYKFAQPKQDIEEGRKARKLKEWEENAGKSKILESLCGKMLEAVKRESDVMDNKILDKLDDMSGEIKSIDKKLEKTDQNLDNVRQGVLDGHLRRLQQSCEIYLKRGYITPDELKDYNSRLEIYHNLGGNGHMDIWNQKIIELPCHDHNQKI